MNAHTRVVSILAALLAALLAVLTLGACVAGWASSAWAAGGNWIMWRSGNIGDDNYPPELDSAYSDRSACVENIGLRLDRADTKYLVVDRRYLR